MPSNELGILLKEARIKAGMSQIRLAQLLHCDRSYISKIEVGEKEPRFTFVKMWLDATNCNEQFVSALCSKDWEELVKSMEKLQKIQEIVLDPIA